MKVMIKIKNDNTVPHWIDDADSYVCSVCGKSLAYKRASCPSCGCYMHPLYEMKEFEDAVEVRVSRPIDAGKDFIIVDIAEAKNEAD